MLGLGDIVIPGFFVALMLRYDVAKGRAECAPPPSRPEAPLGLPPQLAHRAWED